MHAHLGVRNLWEDHGKVHDKEAKMENMCMFPDTIGLKGIWRVWDQILFSSHAEEFCAD